MNRTIRNLLALAGGAGALVALALLMAPSGGFPSRPKFQTVTAQAARTTENAPVHSTSTHPGYQLTETDATADAKKWDIHADADLFAITATTDAGNENWNALVMQRTGAVVSIMNLAATSPIRANGVNIQRVTVSQSVVGGEGMLVGDTVRISKLANTSRASTITVTVDPHLQVTALPAGHYKVGLYLRSPAAAGGFRFRLDISGAGDLRALGAQNCEGVRSAFWNEETAEQACASTTLPYAVQGEGATDKAAATGTIGIFWAQNASNVASTTLNSESWLEVTRLN